MRWTIKGTVHILRDSKIIIGRVLLREDGWHAQWTEGGEVVEVGPFEEPNDARTRIRGNMTKITANELRKAKACAEQVEKFEHLFPDGVVPTVELCKEHADSFNWDWAVQNLLSPKGLAQYDAAKAQARAQYDAATAPALAQYDAAKAQARAQYDAATAPALAQYKAATAPAWAQYQAATAQAWAEQWIAENQA